MPELLTDVASPTWAYLVLLGLLIADAFVPVVPTQIVMITSGALTVYGGLSLPVTIAVGALGVFAGDLACYLLGRSAPDRRPPRHAEPGRARRVASRVTQGLRQPGPLVILLCRFVPGGRMAACFSAGRSRYPYRLFLLYEARRRAGLGHLRRAGRAPGRHGADRVGLAAGHDRQRRGGRVRRRRLGDDVVTRPPRPRRRRGRRESPPTERPLRPRIDGARQSGGLPDDG